MVVDNLACFGSWLLALCGYASPPGWGLGVGARFVGVPGVPWFRSRLNSGVGG